MQKPNNYQSEVIFFTDSIFIDFSLNAWQIERTQKLRGCIRRSDAARIRVCAPRKLRVQFRRVVSSTIVNYEERKTNAGR